MRTVQDIHNLTAEQLTPQDVLELTYLDAFAQGEDIADDWWSGGDHYDLQAFLVDWPKLQPYVYFSLYTVDEDSEFNYLDPVRNWEIPTASFVKYIGDRLDAEGKSRDGLLNWYQTNCQPTTGERDQ